MGTARIFCLFWGLVLLICGQAVAAEEGKFRVAVGDLVLSPSLSQNAAKTVSESSLMADIENALRNGRKFEVLTRRSSALAAIRKEQQLAASDLAAGDAAESGQISNAQAIVNVEVLSFSFGRSSSKVPNIPNKYTVSDSAGIELSVQIIDTRTTAILASFPIKESTASGSSVVNSVGGASRGVLDKTLEKAAGSLANRVADTIFPVQIVSVKDKKIWANRGDDSGMKLGEVFEIFEPGEELIDPQTGESLGSTETEVGTAKVSRVNPKVTVLDVVKGDASAIRAGFILRRPVAKK
jgi:hypothetical protein